MERRELLKMIALVTGSALIGGELLLSGCKNSPEMGGTTFNETDISFLDEVGETILPRTKSPGAKDAAIGQFMTKMVNDCYDKNDQDAFHSGIRKLNDESNKMLGKDFMKASVEERTKLLIDLDKKAKAYQKDKKKDDPNHYFTLMKQLTLFGFFTSKPGATEALRHVAVPGSYNGALPYKKGDRAWAE